MNRLVVLDTETTGLDVNDGHRIIELGCVEILPQTDFISILIQEEPLMKALREFME